LADVADASTARLDQMRLGAVEDHAEAELALGRQRDVIPQLRELVSAHLLRGAGDPSKARC
jgi:hypothetical protein